MAKPHQQGHVCQRKGAVAAGGPASCYTYAMPKFLPPPTGVTEVGNDFWNLRGTFKVLGFLDIGTQASLVRQKNGRFLLLDACPLTPEMITWLLEFTEQGAALDAVLHLHPFHTVYVKAFHEHFPKVTHFGTRRHMQKAPGLPWHEHVTEHPEFPARFSEDLIFSVPRGVDFIPEDESLHFASVLAIHPASRTIHVDDTFNYVRLPVGPGLVRLHPALPKVLQKRSGAAQEFRAWAEEFLELAADAENLCAAHMHPLLAPDLADGPSLAARLRKAVDKADRLLTQHERKYG